MDRRRFLAAGVGGLGLLSGCYSGNSGGGDPTTETPDLGIGIDGVESTDEGALVVVLTAVNESGARENGTVAVSVSIGEDTTTRTTAVVVGADGRKTVRVVFPDVSRAAFRDDGTVRAKLQ